MTNSVNSVNAPIVTTVVKLRQAAKMLNITGTSKFRKVELEETILSSRDGRKAVYELEEAEKAAQVVALVQVEGSFFLPRPVPQTIPHLAKSYDSMEDLNAAKQEQHRVFKANAKAKAVFVGMIRAIKNRLYETGLNTTLRWHEDASGFRLAVPKDVKAA